ncbi:hypothetical protein [Flavihumibacter petaseus]|uniref:Uncharacterized protein n=1 Tax=Flavihumibacter petaseus NBRC 106054 TaxID=1220578 RepID=A0A0E9MZ43_9BACT|nr:hypothetical protein [Flavihumibacter petaseus]GAO42818.1 hypothetical protein FPE01S_01_18360 [Flavihumibacter petaseus NBRC 106054]
MKSFYFIAIPLLAATLFAGGKMLQQSKPPASGIINVNERTLAGNSRVLPVHYNKAELFKKQYSLFKKKNGGAIPVLN